MTLVGNWSLRSIVQRIGKLKGRSAAELRERLGQTLAAELERRGMSPLVGEPTDAEFAELLEPAHAAGADTARLLRAHFATRQTPVFFNGVRSGQTARAMEQPRWGAEREQLVAAAERIMDGHFDLLGYEDLNFGVPIDWHHDPTTGRRAPRQHWSRIPYLDAALIGDHKVIWEINRHQHFMVLGRAFRVTGDARYARRFTEHLESWLDENPPKDGVNWASSLEVAYRAISWLWAIELFRESLALSPALLQRAIKVLYVHGRHLERYLSTYFSPNTHLTGEALGLFYLGCMLPELRRSSHWRTQGWSILEAQLPRQVFADGVYFEQATYYHRYTVDIYLHALILARAQGFAVPEAMTDRLTKAAAHLADLTRPDGTIPVIGDDDGGQLVRLEQRALTDVRAALTTSAVVLNRPELAAVAGAVTEEVLWLLGPEGARTAEQYVATPPPAHTSTLAPVGGYAIMRDGWTADANHAVIDCGPLGNGNSGHAHSDALSIEITVEGCPVFIDPGTYTYTGSRLDRDWFRNSAAHNTVTVDGQSASATAGPFSWQHRADARSDAWWTGKLVDWFAGSHPGFSRLPEPAEHRRGVLFVRGQYWVIIDTVLSRGSHEAIVHYHAAAGAEVRFLSADSATVDVPCASDRKRLFFKALGDVVTLDWGEDWVSSAYGRRTRAPLGRIFSRGTGRRVVMAVIVPLHGDQAVTVTDVPAKEGRAVRLDRPDSHDLLLFGDGGTVRADTAELDGDAAFVRRFTSNGRVESMALFGARATLSVGNLTFHAEGAAEAVRTAEGWVVDGNGKVIARS